MLRPGDLVPWFTAPSVLNPKYNFATIGGYRIVLSYVGTLAGESVLAMLHALKEARLVLAEREAVLFAATADPRDREKAEGLPYKPQQIVTLFDDSLEVARLLKLIGEDGRPRLGTYVLDEGTRVVAFVPLEPVEQHADAVLGILKRLPVREEGEDVRGTAPVLIVPNAIEPELCRQLIDAWHTGETTDSGFMRRNNEGRVVGIIDYGQKRRRDLFLQHDDPLYRELSERCVSRVVPAVKRAFNYNITRVERFCIACYDADGGGYFKAHRDTQATPHRRFAMTVNLNSDEYEGGKLRFPEFGKHRYGAPTGDAILFSGHLMHEALPVTKGRRFALLSFFYSEVEARERQAYEAKFGREHETIRITPEAPARPTAPAGSEPGGAQEPATAREPAGASR
jgi:predicted 2-oxoglutarate/Fe(II)-dependent dioxygenase YbiX/peroxiredoxin